MLKKSQLSLQTLIGLVHKVIQANNNKKIKLAKECVCVLVGVWGGVELRKQDKSEGFDSCDLPSNLTQIGFKSSIFQPVWPWNLMDDLEKL